MHSFRFFYDCLHNNLLKHLDIESTFVKQFNTTAPYYTLDFNNYNKSHDVAFIFDQEPLAIDLFVNTNFNEQFFGRNDYFALHLLMYKTNRFLFNSEHSDVKNDLLNKYNLVDVYYFFHAFAALEWFRLDWYQQIEKQSITKLFICHNHLINQKRLHRLEFLANCAEHNLWDKGFISYQSPGQNTIEKLANESLFKDTILKHQDLLDKNYYLDHDELHGALSVKLDYEHCSQSFVNVVTETVYRENKLHLTEKIFKPVVTKQPFLLLAAPGNLKYFKQYRFKTFNEFWDEGYDSIQDPAERISAVVKILKDLSKLSLHDLENLRDQMEPILEYNRNHFYHNLRPIVARELTTNIKTAFNSRQIPVADQQIESLYKILSK